jgi:RNA polymerase sigma factor (sigma-70 family)
LAEIASQRKQSLIDPLTPRETEILRLIAQGMTNIEIAQRLVITEGTVKNHVTAILSKLEVEDRTQAALRGKMLGLL